MFNPNSKPIDALTLSLARREFNEVCASSQCHYWDENRRIAERDAIRLSPSPITFSDRKPNENYLLLQTPSIPLRDTYSNRRAVELSEQCGFILPYYVTR